MNELKRVTLKTYPHYENLPAPLKNALNLLRTNVFEGVSENVGWVLDENDLEFLNLDVLVKFVKKELPDFDCDFLEAAARLHVETFDKPIFDYFPVNEEDLYNELLVVKDFYECKIS